MHLHESPSGVAEFKSGAALPKAAQGLRDLDKGFFLGGSLIGLPVLPAERVGRKSPEAISGVGSGVGGLFPHSITWAAGLGNSNPTTTRLHVTAVSLYTHVTGPDRVQTASALSLEHIWSWPKFILRAC